MNKKVLALLVIIAMIALMSLGCSIVNPEIKSNVAELPGQNITEKIQENGFYSTPEEIGEYIHTYKKLPSNFITKNEAMKLGWDSGKGNLWDVTDKKSIGGDSFGNREGRLPKTEGRKWHECDVNYFGGYRGGERILYSSDGLIYYTNDHYETFQQLY